MQWSRPPCDRLMRELLPGADVFRLNTGYWEEGAPQRPAELGDGTRPGPIKVLQWFHHPDASRQQ